MTRKRKLVCVPLPLTLKEWRKGQRYILTKLTTAEVKIIYHKMKNEEGKVRTETHKVMDLRNKMPAVIRSIIPEDACVVDEYSTNLDTFFFDKTPIGKSPKGTNYENVLIEMGNNEGALEHLNAHMIETPADMTLSSCITTYKNRYFNKNSFSLIVKTHVTDGKNLFGDDLEIEEIDFRTFKRNITTCGCRDFSGNWQERYPKVYCYKLIDVSVNRFGLGWIAKRVYDTLREMVVDVQQQIVESYEEWKNMSEAELQERELEMLKRLNADLEAKKKEIEK